MTPPSQTSELMKDWRVEEVTPYQGQPDMTGALIVSAVDIVAEVRGGVICGSWGRHAVHTSRARLIAAAPDLLAALEGLLTEAEDIFVCMADATGIDRHAVPKPFEAARAAIVKASGGGA